MSLFADGREANIRSTVAMVEDVLLELGHFVNDCRTQPGVDETYAWVVTRGSATVRIALGVREDVPHLRAASTLMTIDRTVDELGLFRQLLRLNRTALSTAAFAIEGKYVQIVAERPTLDLDRSEVFDLIRRVEFYSDEYDDRLVAAHGGIRGRDPDA